MKTLTLSTIILSAVLTTHTANAQDVQGYATPVSYTQQIKTLASQSSCAKYSFKSRGKAPVGYINGMALTYARSLCRIRANGASPAVAKILSAANTRNTSKDALAYYASIFSARGIDTYTAGDNAVKAIYTLGIGLGMRESSGSYCEGWDRSAGSNRSSAEAEAGLFQVSYDSIGASSELSRLYKEYQANTSRCGLEVFKQGVSCGSSSTLGTGAGATFQKFNKACPAFAAEYGMTMLRVRRNHFGPINRQEAEVVPACHSLLKTVEQMVDANPESLCGEIY